MKGFFRPTFALLFLKVALAFVGLTGFAQAPAGVVVAPAAPLARRISLPALRAPLEMVLREVTRRGNVGLAYSASRLPMQAAVTLPAQHEQPLGEVLATVLHGQPVAFGLLDGQVVLWRQTGAPPPGVVVYRAGKKPAPPAAAPASAGLANAARPPARALPGTTARVGPNAIATASPRSGVRVVRSAATKAGVVPVGAAGGARSTAQGAAPGAAAASAVRNSPAIAAAASGTVAAAVAATARNPAGAAPALAGSIALLAPVPVELIVALDTLPPPRPKVEDFRRPTPPPWRRGLVQVSLVPPLSTNWVHNSRTVNRLSINLLVGYAAGVRGMEVGGLMNIDRDTVAGVQVAALANVTGGPVQGAQVAGLVNVAAGSLEGVQSAGLVNIARGPSQGWQNAGLLNVAHARRGTNSAAAHATTEPLVQLAGIVNTAPCGLKGAQIAGIINSAGYVKGVQIAGVLNIADSVAGVSLAPLNFVRHGYHAFELVTGALLPVRLALKLGGSAAFYTYFVWAIDPGTAHRWGLGYGIGTELASRRRLSFSLDAQGVQINEDDNSLHTWATPLNMHTQFRPMMGWATGRRRRLRLLVGPTVNVFVSQRRDPLTGVLGAGLVGRGPAQLSAVDSQGRTQLRGWIEANLGARWQF